MQRVNTVANNNKGMVTSNAVYNELIKVQSVEDLFGIYGSTYDLNDFKSALIRIGKVYNNTQDYTTYHLPADTWNIVLWLPLTSNTYGIQISFVINRNKIYSRSLSSGDWSSWREVL